jgi:hypothetical protein
VRAAHEPHHRRAVLGRFVTALRALGGRRGRGLAGRLAAGRLAPGRLLLDGAREVVVVTRRKGRDTSLEEFTAAPRVLEGAEWEEAAKILVDRRRSRNGPPEDALKRWRTTCDILELTPNVPAAV